MRRVLGPMAIAIALVGHAAAGGCSSESTVSGGGGCEAFCSKIVGARCRSGPDKERCLEECRSEQARCRPEANALLKCATIEAQIACETGSGQARVVGCLAREAALEACLVCDRFCAGWTALGCPLGPEREECVATCLDRRCSMNHGRIVECMPAASGAVCGVDGRTWTGPMCSDAYDAAARCSQMYGQPQPFRYLSAMPPTPLDDSGLGG